MIRGCERWPVMKWVERGLMTIGVGCLGWFGIEQVQATAYQREQQVMLNRMLSKATPNVVAAVAPMAGLVGKIDVPRLRLSAAVIEGDDETALRVAIGHLPDTPLPWEPGNSALAAHRDTFFRPLKDIAVGDLIRVTTPRGLFEYRVRDSLIVNPEDVWVLEPTNGQTLTLITCYPFSYIGHAPKRFVVRAERTGASSRNDRDARL